MTITQREPFERGDDGFFHPVNEDQVQKLILFARANGLQVRVRGSGHSIPGAIYTDAKRYDRGPMVDMMLDNMASMRFDDARKRVMVEGGCRFARDPRDATKKATDENGICHQIDLRGWALPVLGGVTHQTIAGYLATGSEGGSTCYSLYTQIVSIRLIDGKGEARELSPDRDSDLFYAAGVSLGLLGIVTEVTLQCIDRFDVSGEEATTTLEKSELDLFSDADNGIEKFMTRSDYARLLWWPQPGVNKLVVWKARRTESARPLVRNPYYPLPPILGSTIPMQVAAAVALRLLGTEPQVFWRTKVDIPTLPRLAQPELNRKRRLRSAVYNAFVEETPAPKPFYDSWWQGIPQDNLMVDALLPTTFTEIFIPLRRASEALRRLHAHFEKFGYPASGAYALEVYASSANSFWMSPSYGEPMLRLNFFWLQRHKGDPRIDFFPQFWALLADLGFRLHWAKLLFREGETSASYLKERYPKWNHFMRIRETLDPDQLFVSSYWRSHLGIPALKAEAHHMVPLSRGVARFLRPPANELPLLFKLKPSLPEFAKRARHVFENSAELDNSAEKAYQAFVNVEHGKKWLVFFKGAHWQTEERSNPGAVVDYSYSFMSLRVRVIARELGKKWISSVDACTLPLASRMLQTAEFEPLPGGRSRMQWKIYYDVPWMMRLFHPIARPFFAWLFRRSTREFANYIALESSL